MSSLRLLTSIPDKPSQHTPEMSNQHSPDMPSQHPPDMPTPDMPTPDMPSQHTPDMPTQHTPEMSNQHTPDMPSQHTTNMPTQHTPDIIAQAEHVDGIHANTPVVGASRTPVFMKNLATASGIHTGVPGDDDGSENIGWDDLGICITYMCVYIYIYTYM